MKKLGTGLVFALLMAALLPPVFADREDSQLGVSEITLPEATPGTGDAGVCGVDLAAAPTGEVTTACSPNRGCSTSAQCDGGLCVRHHCFCF